MRGKFYMCHIRLTETLTFQIPESIYWWLLVVLAEAIAVQLFLLQFPQLPSTICPSLRPLLLLQQEPIETAMSLHSTMTLPAAWTTPNPVHAGVGRVPLATMAATTTPNTVTTTNLLETGVGSKTLPTSADVHHFFEKSKPDTMVCTVCW